MKNLIFIFIALIIFLSCGNSASAIVNPTENENNIFGIHIHDESDLEDAAELVNSQGGDWGYVTIVIRKDDINTQKWQDIFNKMRRLHLIPILRIATRQQNGGWEKASVDEIDGWVSFLNSLNWVVKNRYVIVGNEPNHAKEWGNEVNPEEYTQYLYEFSRKLKSSSDEFYILPAALDASAPTDNLHMDEYLFIRRMLAENENVFDFIDGWNSHSYPNPNFSASAEKTGRKSIKTYNWELGVLKSLGITKDFPVFITETGWAHSKNGTNGYFSPETISERFSFAFSNVWLKDEQIVAITPFILNYKEPPFDIFSWKDSDNKYYKFYYDIQNIQKTKGSPEQQNTLNITAVIFPKLIKKENISYGIAYVKNTGQIIWEKDTVEIVKEGSRALKIEPLYPHTIEPLTSGLIFISENVDTD